MLNPKMRLIQPLHDSFDDHKQMNDIQRLDSVLETFVEHLDTFDTLDVFAIVFPHATGISQDGDPLYARH
jgi:hypothetical protein